MKKQNQEHHLVEYIVDLLNILETENIDISNIDATSLMELAREAGDCSAKMPQNIQTAYEAVKFMDEMPGGFLIYHADGNEQIIYANKALLRIFQCSTLQEFRKITNNSFQGLVYPEDLDEVEQSIREQISASQYDLDYVEYRAIRKDGSLRWIEDYGHYIYSESSGGIFYVFIGDATEKRRKQLEEKANILNERLQNEKKLQSLIEEYDKEIKLINQEHLRRLEVIEGLSINYDSILYADLDTDKILPYRLSSRNSQQFGNKLQARSYLWYTSEYIKEWVHPDDLLDVYVKSY